MRFLLHLIRGLCWAMIGIALSMAAQSNFTGALFIGVIAAAFLSFHSLLRKPDVSQEEY